MKRYIGDGVYIQEDARGIAVLTTEDGISVQNKIYMGRQEILAMIRWVVGVGIIQKEELHIKE